MLENLKKIKKGNVEYVWRVKNCKISVKIKFTGKHLWEIDDRNHSNHDTDERNKYNRTENGKTIGLPTNLYFLLNFNTNYLEA